MSTELADVDDDRVDHSDNVLLEVIDEMKELVLHILQVWSCDIVEGKGRTFRATDPGSGYILHGLY
jgi:hypothetical protein